ncbi:MAG: dihydrofolate synthase [Ferruginibacter sp.]|nr:dihydrofolate synthase [Ferruginibacter sp.]
MMDYAQTLQHLYEQLPMFSRIGAAAYKKDLHNTYALCEALGNPQEKIKTIHIAGTNGKGSTSHMLAAILQQAGYKTGLYTSPHIKDFGERIRINGEMISEQFVVDFVAQTQDLCETIKPSFFEVTVAMALAYFAEQEVDIAVIETGLGGRLDSTNIIQPLVSVITNIGYDHTNLLGNTLEEIAGQKAGIIKENSTAIIGEATACTLPVFIKEANEKEAKLVVVPAQFTVEYLESQPGLLLCNIRNNKTGIVEKLRCDLSGLYQSKNLATVLAVVEELQRQQFRISETALHRALENVQQLTGLRGRWEHIGQKPAVIIDVAHNAAGMAQVILQLALDYPHSRPHFVIGFVKDKDIKSVLQLMPANAAYYFTNAHSPRALPHAVLKEMAKEFLLEGEGFDDVNLALSAAKSNALENDVIIICGSFFIAAEINN